MAIALVRRRHVDPMALTVVKGKSSRLTDVEATTQCLGAVSGNGWHSAGGALVNRGGDGEATGGARCGGHQWEGAWREELEWRQATTRMGSTRGHEKLFLGM